MSDTHPLTTTGFELSGYRVVRSFGVVRGIIVRSHSIVGNIGASIQSIFGGNITLYTNLCERARDDAFGEMLTHVGKLDTKARENFFEARERNRHRRQAGRRW